jgi:TatD DNase family protein
MFVDSHCHLTFPGLHDRLDEVLDAMSAARVSRALCICTTIEEFEQVHALAIEHPNLWATVGVHPDNEGVLEPDVAALVERAVRPRVVAIGETGLDHYRIGDRTVAQMAWQHERFRVHIRAARQVGLPLVVHTRSASDDTIRILREEDAGTAGGVFHCFTESMEVARQALDLGFYISFSGIMTFRTAQSLRDVASFVPIDRCLIETDSPYLAPVPHRGRPNMPAHVVHVAAELARIKGMELQDLAQVTSVNFDRLFPRASIGASWSAGESSSNTCKN